MSVAYSNSYTPGNFCLNYLADSGTSTANGSFNPRTYSFNVNANDTFVIVVNEETLGDGAPYTLTVTGGDCRPVLNISQATPTQVKLDWTTAAPGYQLERTNSLVGVTNWPAVPNVPVVVNSRFTVTNSSTLSNQFYRLRKPLP